MNKRFFIALTCIIFLLISGCEEADTFEPTPEPAIVITPPPPIIYEPDCDHFFKNPDCFNPSICIDCGETEGVPLEHIWTEPNFQEPSFCEVCGEINGDPLEPKFIAQGFKINTTSGRLYEYKTITNQDADITTVGSATLLYIDIFESDSGYPAKSGYEYITARLMMTFDDENAQTLGFKYMTGQLDFFGFNPDENAIFHDNLRESDIEGFKVGNAKLNFFGEDYEYYIKHTQIQNERIGNVSYVMLEYAFLVPAGYDGMVIYISNAANWTEGRSRVLSDNFDDNTLFFRLRTQTN